jgi:hypothetical protein
MNRSSMNVLMVFAWVWVGTPFAYGAFQLFRRVAQLFQ